MFLTLFRLSPVGEKVQCSPVPEPSTCFWDGFLPQQSLGQMIDSARHPPSSALAGALAQAP